MCVLLNDQHQTNTPRPGAPNERQAHSLPTTHNHRHQAFMSVQTKPSHHHHLARPSWHCVHTSLFSSSAASVWWTCLHWTCSGRCWSTFLTNDWPFHRLSAVVVRVRLVASARQVWLLSLQTKPFRFVVSLCFAWRATKSPHVQPHTPAHLAATRTARETRGGVHWLFLLFFAPLVCSARALTAPVVCWHTSRFWDTNKPNRTTRSVGFVAVRKEPKTESGKRSDRKEESTKPTKRKASGDDWALDCQPDGTRTLSADTTLAKHRRTSQHNQNQRPTQTNQAK